MVDTERLKKLLKLTTSTFNGEALNAIRKVNEELLKNKQTWDDILGGKSGKRLSSFSDDIANKMMMQSLRKQADELRIERDEYKKDYWNIKHEYDNLKVDYVKDIRDRYEGKQHRKTKPIEEKQKDWFDMHEGYIPKSKRRRV